MTRRRRSRLLGAVLKGVVLLAILTGELSAQEKSFLWRVHSNEHSVDILGSIHLLKKQSYPLNKALEEAFERSKKLVLEIDLRAATPEKIQQLTLQRSMSLDGSQLQQNVSKETYESAVKRAQELGVDIRVFSGLKTWVVAMTMAALKLEKLGFDPNFGIDRYFAGRATLSGKPTGGLETAEFQLDLFDRLSARQQELLLRQSLKEMDHLESNVAELVQAWKSGDVDTIERHLLVGMRDYPEIHRKIIDDRNQSWLPQIEDSLLRGENALIVVGAAHLVGKNGIIELLKRRGYIVEQQ
jgi:uncharacterized protein YbaP (TraB family)